MFGYEACGMAERKTPPEGGVLEDGEKKINLLSGRALRVYDRSQSGDVYEYG